MNCYELIVKGRVQGVGYRYFTSHKATEYNLKGYVKNLYNGDVKIIVQGTEKDINNFIGELKVGPPAAIVENIIKTEIENCKQYKKFSVKF